MGVDVGGDEGTYVGSAVGANVVVGAGEGADVGGDEGTYVGVAVGSKVGSDVGGVVGTYVGKDVGVVGVDVGTPVG